MASRGPENASNTASVNRKKFRQPRRWKPAGLSHLAKAGLESYVYKQLSCELQKASPGRDRWRLRLFRRGVGAIVINASARRIGGDYFPPVCRSNPCPDFSKVCSLSSRPRPSLQQAGKRV